MPEGFNSGIWPEKNEYLESLAITAYYGNIRRYEAMIDFARIIGFDWDEGNRRKNFDSHGVADFEAEEIFFDPAVTIAPDSEHSQQEPRWAAYGKTITGRALTIVFTLRAERSLLRIISARDMSRKERKTYGQKT